MNRTRLRTWGLNLQNRFLRFWKKVRGLKLRQVMGFIVIVKTFNPLIFLLALILFAFLFVQDIRKQYQPALDKISGSYQSIVGPDLQGLRGAVEDARGAFRTLGDVLGVVKSVVNAIIGFVNTIINAIAWFFGMSKIDLSIRLPIPNFGAIFQPFNNLAVHFSDLFEGIRELFAATGVVLGNLWGRFKLFAILAIGWLILSLIGSGYAEVYRGLEMIRGAPRSELPKQPALAQLPSTVAPDLPARNTPPVLIVDRVLITLPVLDKSEEGPGRRSFRYQKRYLLSAQAVWPDRHLPLFYYQLVEQVDAGTWANFWEGLIARGLEPGAVEMVISADTSTLVASVQRFLPQAEVQQSVETTIVTA